MHLVGLAAEVQQNDADLAAIAGVDGGGAVGQRDRVLQRQTAAGADLRLVAGRQLDRQSGGHRPRHAGLEQASSTAHRSMPASSSGPCAYAGRKPPDRHAGF